MADEVPSTALAKPPRRRHRRKARRGAPKPTSGRVGAEPKLSDAKIEAIAGRVADGQPLETACALAAVSHRAGLYWLAMARQIVEQVPGKPKDEVTGHEPEAESPWPKLPAPLLVRFLRAITHARAVDEANRIARITSCATGGALVFEKSDETVNEKTGTKRTVTEKRLAPPDWQADAWLLERRDPDRWGRRARFELPVVPGAGPASGGKIPDFLDVVSQAWALLAAARDPRALPAPRAGEVVEGQAVKVS